MKITKQIEVTVCDRCGKEGYTPNKCASCKKEISVCCSVHYEAIVQKWTPHQYGLQISSGSFESREGLRVTYCIDCSKIMEGKLAEAGFEAFKTKPVIPS